MRLPSSESLSSILNPFALSPPLNYPAAPLMLGEGSNAPGLLPTMGACCRPWRRGRITTVQTMTTHIIDEV